VVDVSATGAVAPDPRLAPISLGDLHERRRQLDDRRRAAVPAVERLVADQLERHLRRHPRRTTTAVQPSPTDVGTTTDIHDFNAATNKGAKPCAS
jgi:hypothetical protein